MKLYRAGFCCLALFFLIIFDVSGADLAVPKPEPATLTIFSISLG
jgi:hypothetical protein